LGHSGLAERESRRAHELPVPHRVACFRSSQGAAKRAPPNSGTGAGEIRLEMNLASAKLAQSKKSFINLDHVGRTLSHHEAILAPQQAKTGDPQDPQKILFLLRFTV
jgi:hypothetical protein